MTNHKSIQRNIPMSTYRQAEGLSKHQLDKFAVCPSYYKWSLSQEFKPSRAMEIGTLIHSLVLEGRIDYAVGPQVDRRTKDGKAEWADFCMENVGKTIINSDEEAVINGAREACVPFVSSISYDPKQDVESSMFWSRSGVSCKGRPDIIGHFNGGLCIVDLKTTSDILSFDRSFWNFRYHVQAEWYRTGLATIADIDPCDVKFVFLVVDTTAPHLCQFVEPSKVTLDAVSQKIEKELEAFRNCLETGFEAGLQRHRIII